MSSRMIFVRCIREMNREKRRQLEVKNDEANNFQVVGKTCVCFFKFHFRNEEFV